MKAPFAVSFPAYRVRNSPSRPPAPREKCADQAGIRALATKRYACAATTTRFARRFPHGSLGKSPFFAQMFSPVLHSGVNVFCCLHARFAALPATFTFHPRLPPLSPRPDRSKLAAADVPAATARGAARPFRSARFRGGLDRARHGHRQAAFSLAIDPLSPLPDIPACGDGGRCDAGRPSPRLPNVRAPRFAFQRGPRALAAPGAASSEAKVSASGRDALIPFSAAPRVAGAPLFASRAAPRPRAQFAPPSASR